MKFKNNICRYMLIFTSPKNVIFLFGEFIGHIVYWLKIIKNEYLRENITGDLSKTFLK